MSNSILLGQDDTFPLGLAQPHTLVPSGSALIGVVVPFPSPTQFYQQIYDVAWPEMVNAFTICAGLSIAVYTVRSLAGK